MLWILALLQLFVGGVSLFFLIRDGSRPYRILAWVILILAVPLLGAALYYLFGVNLRKQKLFDKKNQVAWARFEEFTRYFQPMVEEERQRFYRHFPNYRKLAALLENTSRSMLSFNNKVNVLYEGEDTFDAIFDACARAERFIHLQYYIFSEGELANRFAELFSRKARQGVKVRLIYDGLGSWGLSKGYLRRLRDIGVEVHAFQPVRFEKIARINYRNHRKILVVDGKVGFTGGINVDDKYIKGDPELGYWTDSQVWVEGMAVNFLNFVFLSDWYFVSGENLLLPEYFVLPAKKYGNTAMQIVASGPDSDLSFIHQEFLFLIGAADDYIYIANPYIVPDETMLIGLKSMAACGVEVRLVIPEASDSKAIKWAIRSYFEELMEAGVKIFLFQKGFLHAKLVLVDDTACSIGSANLDIRSFEHNFEVNALVYDISLALQVKQQFEYFFIHSRELSLEHFRNRHWREKFFEQAARLFSPLM